MEDRAIMETRNTETRNNGSSAVSLFEFASIDRAWKFSEQLAKSEIIPDTFKGNPASCLIALDMANRMRRNPMEVMQAIYIVHGKPSFSSSFLIGLINSCGLFDRLRFEWVGEPGTDGRGCRAVTTERRTGERLEGPLITMRMAKEEGWSGKNPKWRTMPDVMLTYRAASFFSRAYCPDLTGGFHSNEELAESDLRAESAAEAIQAQLLDDPKPEPKSEPEVPTGTIIPEIIQPEGGPAFPTPEPNPKPNPEPSEAAKPKKAATPLEQKREEVLELLGPAGLDLNAAERERYLFNLTGERDVKDISQVELSRVASEARAELKKRDEG